MHLSIKPLTLSRLVCDRCARGMFVYSCPSQAGRTREQATDMSSSGHLTLACQCGIGRNNEDPWALSGRTAEQVGT